MSKDTQATIIGIATLVAAIAQLVAQFFGALSIDTIHASVPLTVASGVAALGYVTNKVS